MAKCPLASCRETTQFLCTSISGFVQFWARYLITFWWGLFQFVAVMACLLLFPFLFRRNEFKKLNIGLYLFQSSLAVCLGLLSFLSRFHLCSVCSRWGSCPKCPVSGHLLHVYPPSPCCFRPMYYTIKLKQFLNKKNQNKQKKMARWRKVGNNWMF